MVLNKEGAHSQGVVHSLIEEGMQVVVHSLIEEAALVDNQAQVVEDMVSNLVEDDPIINKACLFCM